MNSQEFMGILIAEAERRLAVKHSANSTSNIAYSTKANKSKAPALLNRMTSNTETVASNEGKGKKKKKPKKPYCKKCKSKGHSTDSCNKWDEDADTCTHCGRFNHESKDCQRKDKSKQNKDKVKVNPRKCARIEETNATDSNKHFLAVTIEEVVDIAPGGIQFDSSQHGQYFNFHNYDVTNLNGIDERTLYYDWLADSATTSHIVNRHDVFKTYEPIKNTPITGVGGL
jgi:hypothetical protein